MSKARRGWSHPARGPSSRAWKYRRSLPVRGVRSSVATLVELLLSDYHSAPRPGPRIRRNGRERAGDHRPHPGNHGSRFPRGSGQRPRDDSSLLIGVDHNACILCDRCIRGCNEIRHNEVLGRTGKGYAHAHCLRSRRPDGKFELRDLRRVHGFLSDGGPDQSGSCRQRAFQRRRQGRGNRQSGRAGRAPALSRASPCRSCAGTGNAVVGRHFRRAR